MREIESNIERSIENMTDYEKGILLAAIRAVKEDGLRYFQAEKERKAYRSPTAPRVRMINERIVLARKCSICGEYKPLFEEYHKNPDERLGYYTQCKTCYGNKRREQYRAYNRTRRKGKAKEVALVHERVNAKLNNELP